MPRTCRACSHSLRAEIDRALAAGEPLRNIAKRVSISPAGLLRHKSHVAVTVAKAQERRQEKLGDSIFAEMRRVFDKGRELLEKFEADGDTRGAIMALREVRATLEAMDTMQSKVDKVKQARIVVVFKRDPETPAIAVPEFPALDVPGRVVQPERPQQPPSGEATQKTAVEPENVAPDRDSYLRALRDVSRAVEPIPRPGWER
jgi:hypothetical protein